MITHTPGSKCTLTPSFRGTGCTLSRNHVGFTHLADGLVGAEVLGEALVASSITPYTCSPHTVSEGFTTQWHSRRAPAFGPGRGH